MQGEELKEFRMKVNNIDLQMSPMTRSLYLWTERGILRHAKILDTEKAWDMYEELRGFYKTNNLT